MAKEKTDPYLEERNSVTSPTWVHAGKKLLYAVIVTTLLSIITNNSENKIYALCSSKGRQIYTVNEANDILECILISGPHVVATGSLGEHGMCSPGAILSDDSCKIKLQSGMMDMPRSWILPVPLWKLSVFLWML